MIVLTTAAAVLVLLMLGYGIQFVLFHICHFIDLL